MKYVTLREMTDLVNEVMALEPDEWHKAIATPFAMVWGDNRVEFPITPETYEIMQMALADIIDALEYEG